MKVKEDVCTGPIQMRHGNRQIFHVLVKLSLMPSALPCDYFSVARLRIQCRCSERQVLEICGHLFLSEQERKQEAKRNCTVRRIVICTLYKILRRLRWVGHVAHIGAMGYTYVLVGKPERKGPCWRRNRDVHCGIVL